MTLRSMWGEAENGLMSSCSGSTDVGGGVAGGEVSISSLGKNNGSDFIVDDRADFPLRSLESNI